MTFMDIISNVICNLIGITFVIMDVAYTQNTIGK